MWDLFVEASLCSLRPKHLSQVIHAYLFDMLCSLHCFPDIVYYTYILHKYVISCTALLHAFAYRPQINRIELKMAAK